jgi:N-acetylneuraminate synthase
MNPYITISGRKIGIDYPPLVIEIGINHEGSLTVAKEMVDAAHRAGVEVVKHQTHIVEDEMQQHSGNATVSIYEIMERCALDETEELELKKYVESKGLIFISTPFSRSSRTLKKSLTYRPIKLTESVTTIH